MNSKTNSNILRSVLAAGLLLGGAAGAFASSLVTFQVDMSNAAFDPSSQTVVVRGTFTGWGNSLFALTNNPSGANSNLWTGTTNLPLNATVIAYKFVTEPGDGYESSHNRNLTLPANDGGKIVAPLAYFNDSPAVPVTVSVTFQVDMAQQINVGTFDPINGVVQARGLFDGWGSSAVPQTNDPAIYTTNQFGLRTNLVWVGTYDITGSPGQTIDYKYHIDAGDNWESPAPGTGDPNDSNNRFFQLGAGPTQAVPIVYFSDSPYAPVATNNVTFQVDMSAQVMGGQFDPSSGSVQLRGDFTSWGTSPVTLTNDPNGANTNVYESVVALVDGVGVTHSYKFWASVSANGGWEIVNRDPGLNRTIKVINGTTQNLAAVYFSDTAVGDLMSADTIVTFSVDMTGALGTDAHAFDPANDQVYVGGISLDSGTWQWIAPFSATDAPQLMTNNSAGSMIYSLGLTIPKGYPLGMVYKYGINSINDEPGGNHVRYVYTSVNYAFPQDKFGVPVVENAVPNLKALRSTPGHVNLTWLGRPGVHLQTKGGLSTGAWTNVLQTDGLSSTNWQTGGSSSFFRLAMP